MANETRVNIKHLLEDLRDAYATPLEEIIVTELVANALDSKASMVAFTIDRKTSSLTCLDDGVGMTRNVLREYHNIATSAKSRGQGIGFAGVGAKLALLLAERVVTESRGGRGSQSASEWQMTGPYRAPWKFISSAERVPTTRGTSVSIFFSDAQSHLLDEEFVRRTIVRHFHPILDGTIYSRVLKFFYKSKPRFFVNAIEVVSPDDTDGKHWFDVRLGSGKRPIGVGYVAYDEPGKASGLFNYLFGADKESAREALSGLSISTYGKVIKGGWEWLGVLPKHHERLHGIVEIPSLAEILTTDKSDFLSDATSLKKYYKHRRAIQEALAPIFASLGETGEAADPEKLAKPIARTLSGVLTHLAADFPELEGLIGGRELTRGKANEEKEKVGATTVSTKDEEGKASSSMLPSPQESDSREASPAQKRIKEGVRDEGARARVRAPRASLSVVLGPLEGTNALGRIIDDVVTVNTLHPAWKKARERGQSEYHVIISVALTLSEYLEARTSTQEFMSTFLRAWAEARDTQGKLFS